MSLRSGYARRSWICVALHVPCRDGGRVTRRNGKRPQFAANCFWHNGSEYFLSHSALRSLTPGPLSSYPFSCNSLPGIAWKESTTLESGFFPVHLSVKRNSRPTACSSRPVSIHYNYMSIGEG